MFGIFGCGSSRKKAAFSALKSPLSGRSMRMTGYELEAENATDTNFQVLKKG
jgi:hypothetical protein